jgi:hypothetical protein
VVPFTGGASIGAALADASRPVQLVAAAGLWTAWGAVVLALLVPRPLGLTALRVVAPAGLVAVVAAAVAGHPSAVGVTAAAVAAIAAMAAEVATDFAKGAAYGDETRHPLRAPGPLLLGPLPLAWALTVAGATAGPLLLAARSWVSGALATVVGLPLAWFLARSIHTLSRRWVVFVPAGLVIHDPMTLRDPVLFTRQTVEVLRPAPADSDSLDLTERAPGLALELVLREKVPMTLMRPGHRFGEEGASARLLFTPARPGAVLADAVRRRIPVDD